MMWITSGYGGSDWGLLTSSVAIEVAGWDKVPKLAQYSQSTHPLRKIQTLTEAGSNFFPGKWRVWYGWLLQRSEDWI